MPSRNTGVQADAAHYPSEEHASGASGFQSPLHALGAFRMSVSSGLQAMQKRAFETDP